MIATLALGANIDTAAEDAPEKFLAYYSDSANQARGWLALSRGTLAAFIFPWFLVRLKLALDTAGRSRGNPGLLAFGGGLVFTSILLVHLVVSNAIGLTVDFSESYRLDPNVAMLLGNMSYFLLSIGMVGIAVLLLATAVTARRIRLLPAWLTWPAIVIAPLSLATAELFLLPLLLFLAWMLGASVVLTRQRKADTRGHRRPEPDPAVSAPAVDHRQV
ncbi:hypothetical protein E1262_12215 [Jiangella aurantiaca]|uniref:DUF4386 domain-containing protein n=1 Tax=Jiangella aurantiaca TaxID=2530373 RepID=A0A4R5ABX8_9ACTN|nr:hypothetical protein [Jiangella aurantiaca]TDD69711.1 hypothetical protein E1262_12215 [Jiangella aurantiaca]